jgi:uncharacterized protein YrzB (UPF0473 family)
MSHLPRDLLDFYPAHGIMSLPKANKYKCRRMNMNEEFGSDIITVTDEEGNEFELELLDDIEFEGKEYSVLVPSNIEEMDVNDPDYGLIILARVIENGEEVFVSVDDDAELDRVYDYYMELADAAEAEEE